MSCKQGEILTKMFTLIVTSLIGIDSHCATMCFNSNQTFQFERDFQGGGGVKYFETSISQ